MADEVIKWEIVGEVLIVITGSGPITDQRWQSFMSALREGPIKKYLGISIGNVEMTSIQRKQGAEVVKERGIVSLVVTDSRLVRGVVTAVGWLGARVSAYSLKDMDKAVEDLDISGPLKDDVLQRIERLSQGVS